MPEPAISIRDVLAKNLKEKRRIGGLTQEKLAEKAGISPHYLAMVEVSRKFPTPEMLERLAAALDVETYRLFEMAATPDEALKLLRKDIVSEIGQVVVKAIQDTLADECKK
jgi:transcriptional regulator with XRE-family HTH domain